MFTARELRERHGRRERHVVERARVQQALQRESQRAYESRLALSRAL